MTTGNTQDEWLRIIDEALRDLPGVNTNYKVPDLGSEDFAQCIDHTLLRLDATKEQVDQLCDEARQYHFKVNIFCPSVLLMSPFVSAILVSFSI